MLTRLKLTAIRERLDALLVEAARRELTRSETLTYLCEQEVADKEQRRIQMGLSIARCTFLRTLEGFDVSAQPAVDLGQIRELAGGGCIANGDALLLLTSPGVGKSHLAVALGREAVKAGYSVLFTTATAMITQLVQAHANGALEKLLRLFAKPKLLIIDELGYLPLEPVAANLFFLLVSRRYERGSLLVTSNRTVSEWGEVFGDAVVATSILDRLRHRSHVSTIRDDSYRLCAKRKAGLIRPDGIHHPEQVARGVRGQISLSELGRFWRRLTAMWSASCLRHAKRRILLVCAPHWRLSDHADVPVGRTPAEGGRVSNILHEVGTNTHPSVSH